MILFDKALWHGLRFVLEKLKQAADSEMDDAPRLRAQLIDAQLRFEAGELSAEELAEIEAQVLERLRALEVQSDRRPIGAARVEVDVSAVPAPVRKVKPKPKRLRRRGEP